MHFKWMRIEKIGDTGKTGIYAVIAKDGDLQLGQIRWFGRWRKYAFFPEPGTVFEATCLHDIADECHALMEQRKALRKCAT
jgi:hypothetical protein